MVARNAFILDEMKKKAEESGEKKGEERGIQLTKKVFKLASKGLYVTEIAKECEISESMVEEILA